MVRSLARKRLLTVLIVMIVIAVSSFGLVQLDRLRRLKLLDAELASVCDSTYLSTEGDRVITLSSDERKTVAILKLIAQRQRPIGFSVGRLELRNLNVSLLEPSSRIEDVFSVTVAENNPIGEREARTLRQTFPKCGLWTFPHIEWSDAVEAEFERFPRGSSIECWDRAPHEMGVFFMTAGNAGITWFGK